MVEEEDKPPFEDKEVTISYQEAVQINDDKFKSIPNEAKPTMPEN